MRKHFGVPDAGACVEPGTHPQLSTLFIDNANKMKLAADPTRFGYHFGLFFAGSGSEGGSVIKDAVL
jgi:hypothetical protein